MTRPIKKHLLLLLLALSFQACNNTAQETHSTEIDLNAYLSPVDDGAEVVAKVDVAGRLDA